MAQRPLSLVRSASPNRLSQQRPAPGGVGSSSPSRLTMCVRRFGSGKEKALAIRYGVAGTMPCSALQLTDRPPDGAPPGSWPPAMQDDPGSERDNTSSMLRESQYEDMEVGAVGHRSYSWNKAYHLHVCGDGRYRVVGVSMGVIAVLSGLHICIMEVDQSVAGAA